MNSQPNPKPKRLYRSRNQSLVAGVCGGVAEYFNIDPTLVRLALVLFAFLFILGGSIFMAIGLYVIAWLIIPVSDNVSSYSVDNYSKHD